MNTKPPKQWYCIDCGAPVNRRVKRCPPCNQANLSKRGTYERTPEARANMSKAKKGKPPRGTGWKHSEATRAKIAAAWDDEKRERARERGERMAADQEWRLRIAQALAGENNPMWQGGITGQKYAPGFSKTLKNGIRERDDYTCQLCGTTEDELGYHLSIHHADYDKANHDDMSLFAVCKRCNSLVNTNRDMWGGYFTALADARRQFSENIGNLIGRKIITQHVGIVGIGFDGGPSLLDLFGID